MSALSTPPASRAIQHKGLPARAANYIFPPRAQDAIPLSEATIFANLGWIAQYKYNDSRTLIKYQPDQPPELWNRHGEKFRNYHAPQHLIDQLEQVHHKLGLSKTSWSLLDGGTLNDKHSAIKNTIVIWDILVLDGTHLLGSTYQSRYDFLEGNLTQSPQPAEEPTWTFNGYDLGLKITDDILMPRNYNGGQGGELWTAIWKEVIEEVNKPYAKTSPLLEGLMFKDPAGKLERGMKEKNNSAWQCRSRVQTGRHLF